MKSKLFISLFFATIVALSATPFLVKAQIPIENLQSTRNVTISGQVKSVVGNNFTLNDGTGEVIVDAGPRWWHQINLSAGESVTVVGEMDEGEFDAFSITRANCQVIQIRPASGSPPWAGDRRKN
jgi:hypothetical protein